MFRFYWVTEEHERGLIKSLMHLIFDLLFKHVIGFHPEAQYKHAVQVAFMAKLVRRGFGLETVPM